ncbi:MAG TPA: hypothetical protein VMD52_01275 [Patescibacteria group bacterium]|nr:hypothetical protein [Patescibacteria group bacterium]
MSIIDKKYRRKDVHRKYGEQRIYGKNLVEMLREEYGDHLFEHPKAKYPDKIEKLVKSKEGKI